MIPVAQLGVELVVEDNLGAEGVIIVVLVAAHLLVVRHGRGRWFIRTVEAKFFYLMCIIEHDKTLESGHRGEMRI